MKCWEQNIDADIRSHIYIQIYIYIFIYVTKKRLNIHVSKCVYIYMCTCISYLCIYTVVICIYTINNMYIYIYIIPVRGSLPPPPPPGPKTRVLQHSAWKRGICSVFCMVGCWRGPQTCKFVGFLQPAFRKRVICNVSASTSWSSAVAPSSISMSNYHIILNLLLKVYSLGNRSDICLYLMLVKLSLRVSSFP